MCARKHPDEGPTPMNDMTGRTAVVTGASSGIGKSTADLLARHGANVALLALGGDLLESAAADVARHGTNVRPITVDVGDSAAVDDAFAQAEDLGDVDAVFNNAGTSTLAAITHTTDEQWDRLVRVNLSGSFYVARAAARIMKARRRGSIVNTASELALVGQGGYSAYTATKGGILAMSRALAGELAAWGIRVNAICPGITDTPLFHAEFHDNPDPEAEIAENERSVAMGRIGTPAEIAEAVVFLLSERASYITGTQFVVDGGRSGCFPVGSIGKPTDPGAG
jgi:NAD(P)-dependent dehydrogenase (short-subunit alcohol dehydrogenase family)